MMYTQIVVSALSRAQKKRVKYNTFRFFLLFFFIYQVAVETGILKTVLAIHIDNSKDINNYAFAGSRRLAETSGYTHEALEKVGVSDPSGLSRLTLTSSNTSSLKADIGFVFPYFGKVYSTVYFTFSGFVTFDGIDDCATISNANTAACAAGGNLPTVAAELPSEGRNGPIIAPFWTQHKDTSTNIEYIDHGSIIPGESYLFNYYVVPNDATLNASHLHWQLVIKVSGSFEIHLRNIPNDAPTIIGFQSGNPNHLVSEIEYYHLCHGTPCSSQFSNKSFIIKRSATLLTKSSDTCPFDMSQSSSPCKACAGLPQSECKFVVTSYCKVSRDRSSDNGCYTLPYVDKCNIWPFEPTRDCEVSEWSIFGPCKCLSGVDNCTKTRTRVIVQDAYNGGKVCPSLTDTVMCDMILVGDSVWLKHRASSIWQESQNEYLGGRFLSCSDSLTNCTLSTCAGDGGDHGNRSSDKNTGEGLRYNEGGWCGAEEFIIHAKGSDVGDKVKSGDSIFLELRSSGLFLVCDINGCKADGINCMLEDTCKSLFEIRVSKIDGEYGTHIPATEDIWLLGKQLNSGWVGCDAQPNSDNEFMCSASTNCMVNTVMGSSLVAKQSSCPRERFALYKSDKKPIVDQFFVEKGISCGDESTTIEILNDVAVCTDNVSTSKAVCEGGGYEWNITILTVDMCLKKCIDGSNTWPIATTCMGIEYNSTVNSCTILSASGIRNTGSESAVNKTCYSKRGFMRCASSGYRIAGYDDLTTVSGSLGACKERCMKEIYCMSIEYNTISGSCRISFTPRQLLSEGSIILGSDWTICERTIWRDTGILVASTLGKTVTVRGIVQDATAATTLLAGKGVGGIVKINDQIVKIEFTNFGPGKQTKMNLVRSISVSPGDTVLVPWAGLAATDICINGKSDLLFPNICCTDEHCSTLVPSGDGSETECLAIKDTNVWSPTSESWPGTYFRMSLKERYYEFINGSMCRGGALPSPSCIPDYASVYENSPGTSPKDYEMFPQGFSWDVNTKNSKQSLTNTGLRWNSNWERGASFDHVEIRMHYRCPAPAPGVIIRGDTSPMSSCVTSWTKDKGITPQSEDIYIMKSSNFSKAHCAIHCAENNGCVAMEWFGAQDPDSKGIIRGTCWLLKQCDTEKCKDITISKEGSYVSFRETDIKCSMVWDLDVDDTDCGVSSISNTLNAGEKLLLNSVLTEISTVKTGIKLLGPLSYGEEFVVELRAMILPSGAGTGVIFRALDQRRFYVFYFNKSTGKGYVSKHTLPTTRNDSDVLGCDVIQGNAHEVDLSGITLLYNTSHTLKVSVAKNVLDLWIDGQSLEKVDVNLVWPPSDTSEYYDNGRVGFYSRDARSELAYIKVNGSREWPTDSDGYFPSVISTSSSVYIWSISQGKFWESTASEGEYYTWATHETIGETKSWILEWKGMLASGDTVFIKAGVGGPNAGKYLRCDSTAAEGGGHSWDSTKCADCGWIIAGEDDTNSVISGASVSLRCDSNSGLGSFLKSAALNIEDGSGGFSWVSQATANPLYMGRQWRLQLVSGDWKIMRTNYNCAGRGEITSDKVTVALSAPNCQVYCAGYKYASFWDGVRGAGTCRCYKECSNGGLTLADFGNVVFLKSSAESTSNEIEQKLGETCLRQPCKSPVDIAGTMTEGVVIKTNGGCGPIGISRGDSQDNIMAEGDVCEFGCLPAYRATFGADVAVCHNGKWNYPGDDPLKCVKKCSLPVLPSHVSLATDNLAIKDTRADVGLCAVAIHGDSCDLQCDEGYIPASGSRRIYCDPINSVSWGYWGSPVFPTFLDSSSAHTSNLWKNSIDLVCVRECPSPVLVPHSKIPDFNYDGIDKGSTGCPINGDPMKCGEKQLLPPASNGKLCSRSVEGDECTFVCAESYVLTSGVNKATCKSGSWVKDTKLGMNNNVYGPELGYAVDLICKKKCSDPIVSGEIPVNAQIDTHTNSQCKERNGIHIFSGSKCVFECKDGYKLVGGNPEATCMPDGNWQFTNNNPLRCEKRCLVPSNTILASNNSHINDTYQGGCTDASLGDHCQISCNQNFSAKDRVNTREMQCLPTSSTTAEFTWIHEGGTCSGGDGKLFTKSDCLSAGTCSNTTHKTSLACGSDTWTPSNYVWMTEHCSQFDCSVGRYDEDCKLKTKSDCVGEKICSNSYCSRNDKNGDPQKMLSLTFLDEAKCKIGGTCSSPEYTSAQTCRFSNESDASWTSDTWVFGFSTKTDACVSQGICELVAPDVATVQQKADTKNITTETQCISEGICDPNTVFNNNESSCLTLGKCSDSTFYTKKTCTDSGKCTDSEVPDTAKVFTTKSTCISKGTCSSGDAVTLETCINGGICEGDTSQTSKTKCESMGSCSELTMKTKSTCTGVCSNSSVLLETECTGICSAGSATSKIECENGGVCSAGSTTTSSACTSEGNSWTANTWTKYSWTSYTWTPFIWKPFLFKAHVWQANIWTHTNIWTPLRKWKYHEARAHEWVVHSVNAKPLECLRQCDPLTLPQNTAYADSTITECTSGLAGDVCVTQCDNGFERVSGDTERTCLPTAKYDGEALVCKRNCPDYVTPLNAVLDDPRFNECPDDVHSGLTPVWPDFGDVNKDDSICRACCGGIANPYKPYDPVAAQDPDRCWDDWSIGKGYSVKQRKYCGHGEEYKPQCTVNDKGEPGAYEGQFCQYKCKDGFTWAEGEGKQMDPSKGYRLWCRIDDKTSEPYWGERIRPVSLKKLKCVGAPEGPDIVSAAPLFGGPNGGDKEPVTNNDATGKSAMLVYWNPPVPVGEAYNTKQTVFGFAEINTYMNANVQVDTGEYPAGTSTFDVVDSSSSGFKVGDPVYKSSGEYVGTLTSLTKTSMGFEPIPTLTEVENGNYLYREHKINKVLPPLTGIVVSNSTSNYTWTGLSPANQNTFNITYSFQVSISNAAGTGSLSSLSQKVAPVWSAGRPKITLAWEHNDAYDISIQFDLPTNRASMKIYENSSKLCHDIFNDVTIAKFGTKPVCWFESDVTLRVRLGSDYSIKAGANPVYPSTTSDYLSLRSDNPILASNAQNGTWTGKEKDSLVCDPLFRQCNAFGAVILQMRTPVPKLMSAKLQLDGASIIVEFSGSVVPSFGGRDATQLAPGEKLDSTTKSESEAPCSLIFKNANLLLGDDSLCSWVQIVPSPKMLIELGRGYTIRPRMLRQDKPWIYGVGWDLPIQPNEDICKSGESLELLANTILPEENSVHAATGCVRLELYDGVIENPGLMIPESVIQGARSINSCDMNLFLDGTLSGPSGGRPLHYGWYVVDSTEGLVAAAALKAPTMSIPACKIDGENINGFDGSRLLCTYGTIEAELLALSLEINTELSTFDLDKLVLLSELVSHNQNYPDDKLPSPEPEEIETYRKKWLWYLNRRYQMITLQKFLSDFRTDVNLNKVDGSKLSVPRSILVGGNQYTFRLEVETSIGREIPKVRVYSIAFIFTSPYGVGVFTNYYTIMKSWMHKLLTNACQNFGVKTDDVIAYLPYAGERKPGSVQKFTNMLADVYFSYASSAPNSAELRNAITTALSTTNPLRTEAPFTDNFWTLIWDSMNSDTLAVPIDISIDPKKNVQSIAEATHVVFVSDYPIPIINIRGGSTISVTREKSINIEADIVPPTCDIEYMSGTSATSHGSNVNPLIMEWSGILQNAVLPQTNVPNKNTVGPLAIDVTPWSNGNSILIPSFDLRVCGEYEFSLKVSWRGFNTTVATNVHVIPGDLIAQTLGGKVAISTGSKYTLDASPSHDRDNIPLSDSQWVYKWDCEDPDSVDKKCRRSTMGNVDIPKLLDSSNQNEKTWHLIKNILLPNKRYIFSLDVSRIPSNKPEYSCYWKDGANNGDPSVAILRSARTHTLVSTHPRRVDPASPADGPIEYLPEATALVPTAVLDVGSNSSVRTSFSVFDTLVISGNISKDNLEEVAAFNKEMVRVKKTFSLPPVLNKFSGGDIWANWVQRGSDSHKLEYTGCWDPFVGECEFSNPSALIPHPLMSFGTEQLIIGPGILKQGTTYNFAFVVESKNLGLSSADEIAVLTSAKPVMGKTTVDPPSGIAATTTFRFMSSEWSDTDKPLMFRFSLIPLIPNTKLRAMNEHEILLSSWSYSSTIQSKIPREGYFAVVGEVRDSTGAVAQCELHMCNTLYTQKADIRTSEADVLLSKFQERVLKQTVLWKETTQITAELSEAYRKGLQVSLNGVCSDRDPSRSSIETCISTCSEASVLLNETKCTGKCTDNAVKAVNLWGIEAGLYSIGENVVQGSATGKVLTTTSKNSTMVRVSMLNGEFSANTGVVSVTIAGVSVGVPKQVEKYVHVIGSITKETCLAKTRSWIPRKWSNRYWSSCSDTLVACSDILDCENTLTPEKCINSCTAYKPTTKTYMLNENKQKNFCTSNCSNPVYKTLSTCEEVGTCANPSCNDEATCRKELCLPGQWTQLYEWTDRRWDNRSFYPNSNDGGFCVSDNLSDPNGLKSNTNDLSGKTSGVDTNFDGIRDGGPTVNITKDLCSSSCSINGVGKTNCINECSDGGISEQNFCINNSWEEFTWHQRTWTEPTDICSIYTGVSGYTVEVVRESIDSSICPGTWACFKTTSINQKTSKVEMKELSRRSCSGHGVCGESTTFLGLYVCTCTSGWHGRDCAINDENLNKLKPKLSNVWEAMTTVMKHKDWKNHKSAIDFITKSIAAFSYDPATIEYNTKLNIIAFLDDSLDEISGPISYSTTRVILSTLIDILFEEIRQDGENRRRLSVETKKARQLSNKMLDDSDLFKAALSVITNIGLTTSKSILSPLEKSHLIIANGVQLAAAQMNPCTFNKIRIASRYWVNFPPQIIPSSICPTIETSNDGAGSAATFDSWPSSLLFTSIEWGINIHGKVKLGAKVGDNTNLPVENAELKSNILEMRLNQKASGIAVEVKTADTPIYFDLPIHSPSTTSTRIVNEQDPRISLCHIWNSVTKTWNVSGLWLNSLNVQVDTAKVSVKCGSIQLTQTLSKFGIIHSGDKYSQMVPRPSINIVIDIPRTDLNWVYNTDNDTVENFLLNIGWICIVMVCIGSCLDFLQHGKISRTGTQNFMKHGKFTDYQVPPAPDWTKAKGRFELFLEFDEDGSGEIDASEISRVALKLKVIITPIDIAKLLEKVTGDATGEVDYGAFKELLDEFDTYRRSLRGRWMNRWGREEWVDFGWRFWKQIKLYHPIVSFWCPPASSLNVYSRPQRILTFFTQLVVALSLISLYFAKFPAYIDKIFFIVLLSAWFVIPIGKVVPDAYHSAQAMTSATIFRRKMLVRRCQKRSRRKKKKLEMVVLKQMKENRKILFKEMEAAMIASGELAPIDVLSSTESESEEDSYSSISNKENSSMSTMKIPGNSVSTKQTFFSRKRQKKNLTKVHPILDGTETTDIMKSVNSTPAFRNGEGLSISIPNNDEEGVNYKSTQVVPFSWEAPSKSQKILDKTGNQSVENGSQQAGREGEDTGTNSDDSTESTIPVAPLSTRSWFFSPKSKSPRSPKHKHFTFSPRSSKVAPLKPKNSIPVSKELIQPIETGMELYSDSGESLPIISIGDGEKAQNLRNLRNKDPAASTERRKIKQERGSSPRSLYLQDRSKTTDAVDGTLGGWGSPKHAKKKVVHSAFDRPEVPSSPVALHKKKPKPKPENQKTEEELADEADEEAKSFALQRYLLSGKYEEDDANVAVKRKLLAEECRDVMARLDIMKLEKTKTKADKNKKIGSMLRLQERIDELRAELASNVLEKKTNVENIEKSIANAAKMREDLKVIRLSKKLGEAKVEYALALAAQKKATRKRKSDMSPKERLKYVKQKRQRKAKRAKLLRERQATKLKKLDKSTKRLTLSQQIAKFNEKPKPSSDRHFVRYSKACNDMGIDHEPRQIYNAVLAIQSRWRIRMAQTRVERAQHAFRYFNSQGADPATAWALMKNVEDVTFDSDCSADADEDLTLRLKTSREAKIAKMKIDTQVYDMKHNAASSIQLKWRVQARQKIYNRSVGCGKFQQMFRGDRGRTLATRKRELLLWNKSLLFWRIISLLSAHAEILTLVVLAVYVNITYGVKMGPEQSSAFLTAANDVIPVIIFFTIPIKVLLAYVLSPKWAVLVYISFIILFAALQALAITVGGNFDNVMPFSGCLFLCNSYTLPNGKTNFV